MGFDATVSVHVQHRSGPEIQSAGHILSYLVTDAQTYGNTYQGGVTFSVCPTHDDPDACGCDGLDDALYSAVFLSAGVVDQDNTPTSFGT